MRKYKTKTCIIEAVEWNGNNIREIYDFITNTKEKDIEFNGENFIFKFKDISLDKYKVDLIIKTLEGEMKASYGDYIIKGVLNEFYPCKPEAFNFKYEEIV